MKEDKVSIKFIFEKRWQFCCLFFFSIGCNTYLPQDAPLHISIQDSLKKEAMVLRAFLQIDSAKKIIHTGDLITRTGNDFTSESLRNLNQHEKTYSHCGIASIENDSFFVYHALGGDFNPDQKIMRESLNMFSEPYSNRGIGVFRYQLKDDEIKKVMLTTKKLFAAGVMFDMKFDLATDDRMYCAEFVYKSLLSAGSPIKFSTSHIKDFLFIGVDDLFDNPFCKEIKRVSYK